MEYSRIELLFDDHLTQVIKWKLTHEQLQRGIRHEELQQVKDWKLKFGFKFNIYSNDHLIEGKKHFHFDNDETDTHCKLDFEGNILEQKGKAIPSNIYKELIYFLAKRGVSEKLNEMWDNMNPPSK